MEIEVGGKLPEDVNGFLRLLEGPTFVRVPGRDRNRTRAMVTLLHGNEPSGVCALHRLLRQGPTPAVDLICGVASVEAALKAPGFSYRALPGHWDLNRRFLEPFDRHEGQLAEVLLRGIRQSRPEALIDLHNTSGSSPAYCVVSRIGPAQEALASLFADRLIHTDLRLGTLMEAMSDELTTVTVQCGGAVDPAAMEVAFRGLERYASLPTLPAAPDVEPQIVSHPVRIELLKGAGVVFAERKTPWANVTLPPDVDRWNFRTLEAGTPLGWLGSTGLAALHVTGSSRNHTVSDLLAQEGDRLVTACDLQLLMVATDPKIAANDCLFYVVPVAGHSQATGAGS